MTEYKNEEKHIGQIHISSFIGDKIVGLNGKCPLCKHVFNVLGMRINGNIIGISDSDIEDAINGKNVNGVCHKFICPCNGNTGFTEEQANCLNDLVMDPELRISVVHGCPDVISMTKEEVCSFLQRDGLFKKGDQIDPHLTDIGLEMLGLEKATHFKMVLGVSKPYTVVCESQ